MNRADLLYSCLRDGSPWTRRDIYEHVGEFFLTNNAAAELRVVLRPRGQDVLHSRAGRLDVYQIGPLREREPRQAQPQDYPRSPEGCCDDSGAEMRQSADSRSLSDPLVDGPLREPRDKGLGGRAAAPPHIGVPSHRAPLGSLNGSLTDGEVGGGNACAEPGASGEHGGPSPLEQDRGTSPSVSDPLIPSPLVPQPQQGSAALHPRPTSGEHPCSAPPPLPVPAGAAQLVFEVAA